MKIQTTKITTMKKGLLITILAVIAIAAIGATIYFVSTSDKRQQASMAKQRENIEDKFVCYINLDQLAQKGAFSKHITPENRRLIASAAKTSLENGELSAHLAAIIEDLNNSGIDFTKPMYGYFVEEGDLCFIASVHDASLLDKSVELISLVTEEENGMTINVEKEGDTRSFMMEECVVYYNDSRIALCPIIMEYENAVACATKALERPTEDFAFFGQSDAALFLNIEELSKMIKNTAEESRNYYTELIAEEPEYSDYYNAQIEELNQSLAMLDQYTKDFKDNANILMSLTFDPGRARINLSVDLGEQVTASYESLYNRTSNAHLEYFSNNVMLAMNYSINGPELANTLNTTLNDPTVKRLIDEEIGSNGAAMLLSIASDVLKSINGDVTLGVDDIDGSMVEKYDYYWDYTYNEPSFKSIKAAGVIDVTDKYIIANVGQFGAGFLTKVSEDNYTAQYDNLHFTLQQENNVLFGGVNMDFEKQTRSAIERPWAEEVNNSLGYMILDIDNIMKNKFIKAMSDELMDEIDYELRGTYQQATEMFSYIYCVATDVTTSEIGIVFDDQRTNSLEQMSNLLLPIMMEAAISELF